MAKLTKTEQRWAWLAARLWPSGTGWTRPDRVTNKADARILERRIAVGHVETDEYGLIRITESGRAALKETLG